MPFNLSSLAPTKLSHVRRFFTRCGVLLLGLSALVLSVTWAQDSDASPADSGTDSYQVRTIRPSWFSPAHVSIPPSHGEVIPVATAEELLAAAERLPAGGTILVTDGQYKLHRPVILDRKTNIVLRSAGGDPSKVVLTGKGWASGDTRDDILRIARCEGVTIADLSFADCRSYGIKVEGEHGPKDVHILNCRFRDIGVRAIKGSAAQDSGRRALRGSVRGCEFQNTRIPPADWLFGGDYISAIDMMALEEWVFSDNVFRDIKGRNGGGRAAIFIWVRSQKVVVERNLIVNCDRGVAFGNPGQSTANVAGERIVYVADSVIRNNFIAGGPDCGIELWHAERIKVFNNTIWRPERNWNRGIRIGTGTTDTEIANNLIHGGIQAEGGEARVHHNLAGRLDGYFEEPASGHLALTVAAGNAFGRGLPLAEITDDITDRPRLGAPDLGAWQSPRPANFTSGSGEARKFGIHEVVLVGRGSVSNPFDTGVTVKFTPPSGPAQAVTVDAFYDGGDVWRARVYVSEAGRWEWFSSCATDPLLGGKSGAFSAHDSNLRGMLRKHRGNPRAWMTDDNRWFGNLSDTGYRLFHSQAAPLWQEFIRDAAAKGINCIRAAALGGWGETPGAPVDDNNTWVWNDPWAGGATPDYGRFDLGKFQNTDGRLAWILDQYPEMYVQMILFSFKGYGSEGTGQHWASLPAEVRVKTMRYMIARWAAFPHVFWLIVNDMHCDERFPQNRAFVREVGTFFDGHAPWRHLISTGPNRRAGFPFTSAEDLRWCSYIHLEDANAVGADQIQQHHLEQIPLHVWMAEDYYEQDHGHYEDPRFFFRWLFWSWLFSGGSANYCGRWGPIDPYTVTGHPAHPWKGIDGKTVYTGEQLVGLDSMPFLAGYLRDRNLDLGLFEANDGGVDDLDGRTGRLRPKLTRRGRSEFLVYHPNALADGKAARVDMTRTARMRLDLADAPGTFRVEWFRAYDGVSAVGDLLEGGGARDVMAPWKGEDVVLRVLRDGP